MDTRPQEHGARPARAAHIENETYVTITLQSDGYLIAKYAGSATTEYPPNRGCE
jgi:hypothetical protein